MPEWEGPLLEVPPPVPFAITFWRDGFTVNDSPLRNGRQPEDEMFLQSVSRGLVITIPGAHNKETSL